MIIYEIEVLRQFLEDFASKFSFFLTTIIRFSASNQGQSDSLP